MRVWTPLPPAPARLAPTDYRRRYRALERPTQHARWSTHPPLGKIGQRHPKPRTCNPLLTPAIEEVMDVLPHFRTDENLTRMYENRLSVERIIAGNNMERDAALKRAEELEQAMLRIDEQRRIEAQRAKEADELRRVEAERANALAAELARLRARYGEI